MAGTLDNPEGLDACNRGGTACCCVWNRPGFFFLE